MSKQFTLYRTLEGGDDYLQKTIEAEGLMQIRQEVKEAMKIDPLKQYLTYIHHDENIPYPFLAELRDDTDLKNVEDIYVFTDDEYKDGTHFTYSLNQSGDVQTYNATGFPSITIEELKSFMRTNHPDELPGNITIKSSTHKVYTSKVLGAKEQIIYVSSDGQKPAKQPAKKSSKKTSKKTAGYVIGFIINIIASISHILVMLKKFSDMSMNTNVKKWKMIQYILVTIIIITYVWQWVSILVYHTQPDFARNYKPVLFIAAMHTICLIGYGGSSFINLVKINNKLLFLITDIVQLILQVIILVVYLRYKVT